MKRRDEKKDEGEAKAQSPEDEDTASTAVWEPHKLSSANVEVANWCRFRSSKAGTLAPDDAVDIRLGKKPSDAMTSRPILAIYCCNADFCRKALNSFLRACSLTKNQTRVQIQLDVDDPNDLPPVEKEEEEDGAKQQLPASGAGAGGGEEEHEEMKKERLDVKKAIDDILSLVRSNHIPKSNFKLCPMLPG